MARPIYEVSCMMCGTEIGEVRNGRFIHDARCTRPLVFRGGFLRCCRCGGSLYRERADALTFSSRSLAAALYEQSQVSVG